MKSQRGGNAGQVEGERGEGVTITPTTTTTTT